ncbi:hypothetical protein GGX14DRAFT_391360 [Mycena pura]|uniref:Uncharacterized protein n=1 Tax=Mycena pura TaxID=153505 RepID=A0AAD6VLH6_9AGAR|nr:hypothetical protein GGX14DRAFT_391360 [Mycena pura]
MHPKAPRIGRAPQLLASAPQDAQRALPLAHGAADGRFLSLVTLLPRLVALRHPSKAVIVNSSIATVHVARRHRVLTAQTPRVLYRKAEALQMDGMQEEEGAGMGTPAALHQVQAHAHTPTHAHVRHAQQGRFAFKAPASASPPVHLALAGTSPTAYACVTRHCAGTRTSAGALYDLQWGLFDTDIIPADHLCLTHARDDAPHTRTSRVVRKGFLQRGVIGGAQADRECWIDVACVLGALGVLRPRRTRSLAPDAKTVFY